MSREVCPYPFAWPDFWATENWAKVHKVENWAMEDWAIEDWAKKQNLKQGEFEERGLREGFNWILRL